LPSSSYGQPQVQLAELYLVVPVAAPEVVPVAVPVAAMTRTPAE
jgi:hypothetical protein